MSADKKAVLRFDDFALDPAERRITRRGIPVDLGGKPLELLELLLENAPTLVSRDQIRAALWPDRVIEYDAAINAAIRDIRHALGDDPKRPRYVETVPRHGYRFLVPVARRSIGERRKNLAVVATGAVAAAILAAVGIGLFAGPGETEPAAPSDAARNAFVRAEHLLSTHEPGNAQKALPLLEEAVAIDADFADAWAALSDAWYFTYDFPERTMPAAIAAVERALALDPNLSRAHRRLADIQFAWRWRFDEAEASYRRALAIDAGDASTLHAYAAFLMAAGRYEEAIAHMERALAIDPLSTVLHGDLAWFYAMGGQHGAALEECGLLAELAPDNRRAIACPLRSLLALGRLGDAANVTRRLMQDQDDHQASTTDQLTHYWQRRLDQLQAAIDEGRYVEPVAMAQIHARLGEPVRALEWIEQSRQQRSRLFVYLRLYPEFRALHGHPRFIDATLPGEKIETIAGKLDGSKPLDSPGQEQ